MALYLSPIANDQQMDANGDPLVGGKINTYLAGSTTPVATYTSSTGGTAQANPIILNSLGIPTSPIWLAGGVSYKFVITDSTDVVLRTVDGITGVNDVSSTAQEWNESGLVPTYISATQFSVPGDQTALLQVNRRLRNTVTAGYAYGRISVSSFGAGITTITMVNDSTPLDSGLSAVAYGFLSYTPSSVPFALYAEAGANTTITSLSGLTTPLSKSQGGTGTAIATRQLAQIQTLQTGALATGTTVIPFDNTIPQQTEGDQYMSLAITPKDVNSTLEIDVTFNFGSATGLFIALALFQDSTANALSVVAQNSPTTTLVGYSLTMKHIMTAGTTSATTFKVRAGPNTAATVTFNGGSGAQNFGGVLASRITIKEYLP